MSEWKQSEQMLLTVIIRDPGPFIHLQEPPTHRTVRLWLTPEQRAALALKQVGSVGGTPVYEEISTYFLEAQDE